MFFDEGRGVDGRRVAERRAHERRRIALGGTVASDHEPPVGCRTVDLSLGGALLEAPTLLGSNVVVVLVLDGLGDNHRLIPIAAEVIGQSVDVEAGVVVARIAFRRMTRGGKARLTEVLEAVAPV